MAHPETATAHIDRDGTLAVGHRLNARYRRFMLVGGVFNLGFVVAIHLFVPGQVAYLFALCSFMSGVVALADLHRFPEVGVLNDGLEIGHRFVPYSSVQSVAVRRVRLAMHIVVAYTYHGAECEASVIPFAWTRKPVGILARKLAARVGLRPHSISTESGTLWSR